MSEPLTANEAAALEELEWELSAPHTQEEIAARLRLSRGRIAQIEAAALEKLRAFADPDWLSGVREPPLLTRRMGAVVPTTGSAEYEE